MHSAKNFIVFLMPFVFTLGCAEEPSQSAVEGHIASELISMLKKRDYLAMERPTNFAHLFMEHHAGRSFYPYVWEKRLREFGKNAGFTNSFFEKYVVLPPGLTLAPLKGDLILMTARPFPYHDEEFFRDAVPIRILISKIGLEHEKYRIYRLTETEVTNLFAQQKIQIPRPITVSPPPPPSPEEQRILNARLSYSASDRVRIICGRIASRIGMTEGHWPTVLFLFIIFLIALIVGVFLFRSGRRVRHE